MASQRSSRAARLVGIAALLAVASSLVLPARPAAAEWKPGGYLSKALARVMAAGRHMAEKTSYGWDSGICLMGSFIKPRDSIAFARALAAGESYVFVGGADDDSKDLDLLVLDADGHRVARDTTADPTPVVEFAPQESGQYTIRLSLVNAGSASFCTLGVFRKEGYHVPMDSLSTAAARLIGACSRISDQADGARFHQEPNQWALFGSVMREGESRTINGLTPEDGNHAVVALGDDNARNLDLSLLDGDGDPLREDTDDGASSHVLCTTKKGSRYGLRIRNTSSDGASLVMAAILDLGTGK